MSGHITGLNASTGDRYQLEAGKVFFDFQDGQGGGAERNLGATRQGSVFEATPSYRVVPADGSFGPVKGLRRIDGVAVKLTVNLLETMTVDNILAAIAGAASADTSWTWKNGEYLGTGTELDSGIAPGGATDIDAGTLQVWYTPAALGVPTKATLDTDYTVHSTTQVITRVGGGSIGDTDLVTVTYRYDTSASGDNFDIITLDQIDANDYHDVALATEVSSTSLSNPAFFLVQNALSVNGLSVTTAPRDESVWQLGFEGHFLASALTLANSPFEIWLPAA